MDFYLYLHASEGVLAFLVKDIFEEISRLNGFGSCFCLRQLNEKINGTVAPLFLAGTIHALVLGIKSIKI